MSDAPTTNAARLREFHRTIGADSPQRPTPPTPERLRLRWTLIEEEVGEVRAEVDGLLPRLSAGEALAPADLAPLAHELADLLYVTYGALDQLGIDADAVFAEVHRANLSKANGPRRADGKLLKPAGWRPADVRGVLERLGREAGSYRDSGSAEQP